MDTTLSSTTLKLNLHHPKFIPNSKIPTKPFKPICLKSSYTYSNTTTSPNPIIHTLKTTARTLIFAVTAVSFVAKFHLYPARAEPIAPPPTQETSQEEEKVKPSTSSVLSDFLESNAEAIGSLKTLLQEKLEAGEDEESLVVLKKLVAAQPEEVEWKFLMARVYNEMGESQEARRVFEEILERSPLSFDALFENALLMDKCGEGEGVIRRLEEALRVAEEEKKAKEARDVRFIIAQVHFLQKNVDEALKMYDQLGREDPSDFRPYFAKGMIYSLMDKNNEAKEQFAKYRELSPKKFEVEGYLRSPLSRMKLFGTEKDN